LNIKIAPLAFPPGHYSENLAGDLGQMIEPLLLGIVLGLIAVTLGGLFFAAYLQYRRGNQFDL
jgi:cytochrome b6-f complex subunit 5